MSLFPPPVDVRKAALFLDLDGTLAPFAPRPELVVPSARRTAAVSAVADALSGRLAVISGRSLIDIDRILEGAALAAAGVHGLERRSADGKVVRPLPHPALRQASSVFHGLAQAEPGLLVEDKGLSVALHYRNAPQAADIAEATGIRLAEQTGLKLQRGDCVVELRTPGCNKGDALRAFMQAAPFQGAQPIFVGDDLTDEAGFAAAQELGGYGVRVGVADRSTQARFALPDIEAVLNWLEMTGAPGRALARPSASTNGLGRSPYSPEPN